MFSLIHPSRQRAHRAKETYDNWMSKKSGNYPVEYLLSLDSDDDLPTYRSLFEHQPVSVLVNGNRSAVDAINKGAEASKENILMVVSDDFDCPPNWDELIVEATRGQNNWILKTRDGIQSWIITLPILDRKYYNKFGYIYYPEYLHMFCDTDLTAVADLTGRKLTADIMFVHNHPSIGKSKRDAINIRADRTVQQGEKVFLERYRNNFGLTETAGSITDPGYIRWIKKKLHQ